MFHPIKMRPLIRAPLFTGPRLLLGVVRGRWSVPRCPRVVPRHASLTVTIDCFVIFVSARRDARPGRAPKAPNRVTTFRSATSRAAVVAVGRRGSARLGARLTSPEPAGPAAPTWVQ